MIPKQDAVQAMLAHGRYDGYPIVGLGAPPGEGPHDDADLKFCLVQTKVEHNLVARPFLLYQRLGDADPSKLT